MNIDTSRLVILIMGKCESYSDFILFIPASHSVPEFPEFCC